MVRPGKMAQDHSTVHRARHARGNPGYGTRVGTGKQTREIDSRKLPDLGLFHIA